MRDTTRMTWFGLLSAATMTLGLGAGCSFDEVDGCVSDDDCRLGRVCAEGACVDPGAAADMGGNNTANGSSNSTTVNNATTNNTSTNNTSANNIAANNIAANNIAPNNTTPNNVAPNNTTPNNTTPNNTTPNNTAPNNTTTPDMGMMPPPDMGTEPDMMTAPDMGMEEPDMAPAPVLGPQIAVTPSDEINFGILTVGQTTTAQLLVENVGDAPLEVTSLDLRARPSQGFDVAPVVDAMNPLQLAPGASSAFTVTFQPTVQSSYGNGVVIASTDADDPSVEVDLSGRAFEPSSQRCLTVSPDPLDFGLVTQGSARTLQLTLGNCSSQQPVTVTDLTLNDGMQGFSFTSSQQPPFSLQVGQSTTVDVTFTSTGADASDELEVFSDSAFGTRRTVDLLASGGACPEAVARGEAAQDLLGVDQLDDGVVGVQLMDTANLTAAASSSASGQLLYDWTLLSAPAGSMAQLSAATTQDTTLTPDVEGVYVVQLDVTDPVVGLGACSPQIIEVVAMPGPAAMRATVTWVGDHDIDLHVLRSDANGNWPMFGDVDEDLHYDNRHPDWGQPMVVGDDGLHLGDDTDGEGPEIGLVGALEAGRDYRVIAQFARNDGAQPFRFDVTAEVEVVGAAGTAQASSLTHEFFLQQRGQRWIAFDIDGDTGMITPVDQTQ